MENDILEVANSSINRSLDTTEEFVDWTICSPGQLQRQQDDEYDPAFNFELQQINLMDELHPSIPSFIGNLGEVQPISGNTQSWEWVIEQLKSYPRTFGQHGETTFIHKELYRDQLPHMIRAAFGVSAAYACTNEGSKSMLFRTLDAGVQELLEQALDETLLEALARLQAMALYQIIRLFHGDLRQRTLAEQQENMVGAWGLQLLQRASVELRGPNLTWKDWMIAESIRRTVLVTFMLYGVYSVFKHGICPEYPTLSILPVSTQAVLWKSPEAYLHHDDLTDTMKYRDFTEFWLASPRRKLEPFEKMLLVACKGTEQVEALSFPDSLG
jgi:hypothetical protein